ncbi:MAG: hypothetical protein M9962_05770 [Oligoflexia bacterium]|nr:hypothetical protein [Oligoflexia bacterium]
MLKWGVVVFFGLTTGLILSSYYKADRAALPIWYWQKSSLLREFDNQKNRIYSSARDPNKTNNYLVKAIINPISNEQFKIATRDLASEGATSYMGIIESSAQKKNFFDAELAIEIQCTQNSDHCCFKSIYKRNDNLFDSNEPKPQWELDYSRKFTARETIELEKNRYLAYNLSLNSYRLGLALAYPFIELPTETQSRTGLYGFNPENDKWELMGQISWHKVQSNGSCDL